MSGVQSGEEKWATQAHQTADPVNERTKELPTEDVERAVELYQYDPTGCSPARDLFHSPRVVTRFEASSSRDAFGGTLVGVVPIRAGSNCGALSFSASRSNLGKFVQSTGTGGFRNEPTVYSRGRGPIQVLLAAPPFGAVRVRNDRSVRQATDGRPP